jgi:uncharacterized hydrophobic protein (TIGR00271 family)
MLNKILEYFRLLDETEEPEIVIERISKDSVFKGTNLWILVFAIFIASLGLNINSTAVIIGAMLISPLMGPIMGIGMGVAINDLHLAKEAVKNFSFAVFVGLVTSFIYFSITPLSDAYSELLARTSPTIYDVMIALFGGLAGIVANSSKQKGNVVPGVAIATALMPPLCTAGYGLATFQLNYFFGAIYLFTINTVFIALATFITLKILKYPIRHLRDSKSDKRSLRIISVVTLLTIIPSIYFGYEMIQQNRFTRSANLFIESNTSIEGTYLLNKNIDASKNIITLVFGGRDLTESQIKYLNNQLEIFGLKNTSLNIKQGISFLTAKKESERVTQLSHLLATKDQLLSKQNKFVDSISSINAQNMQLLKELKINYPDIEEITIKPFTASSDSLHKDVSLVLAHSKKTLSIHTRSKIEKWLRIRLNDSNIRFREFH